MKYLRLSFGLASWILFSGVLVAGPSFEIADNELADTLVQILEGEQKCNALSGCPKKEGEGQGGPVLGGGVGPDKSAAEWLAKNGAHSIACDEARKDAKAKLEKCDVGCVEQVLRFEDCSSEVNVVESDSTFHPGVNERWLDACKLMFPDRDCTLEDRQGYYYAFAEGTANVKVTRYCKRAGETAQCAAKTAVVSEE